MNKKRTALLSLTGLLLVTTLSNPASQGFQDKSDSASPDFLSVFTNFLSNPPIVATLKYSQTNHLLMNNSGFYEAKWQPGAIYLRKGSSMAELLPNGGAREQATLSLAQYGNNSYSMLIGNQYLEVLTAETREDPSKSKVEREALQ